MSRKNWGALGCAAFVGAALAFPAGVVLGGRDAVPRKDRPQAHRDNASPVKARFRNVYSPEIHNDPYVQDQQQKVVEALEARCRKAGERCALAKAARRWLSEQR